MGHRVNNTSAKLLHTVGRWSKRGKFVEVQLYNKRMGGVDYSDQEEVVGTFYQYNGFQIHRNSIYFLVEKLL